MTRKDYKLISAVIALINIKYIREADNTENTDQEKAFVSGALRGIQLITNGLASELSKENSRFNAQKFLEACVVERDPRFLMFSPSSSIN